MVEENNNQSLSLSSSAVVYPRLGLGAFLLGFIAAAATVPNIFRAVLYVSAEPQHAKNVMTADRDLPEGNFFLSVVYLFLRDSTVVPRCPAMESTTTTTTTLCCYIMAPGFG